MIAKASAITATKAPPPAAIASPLEDPSPYMTTPALSATFSDSDPAVQMRCTRRPGD